MFVGREDELRKLSALSRKPIASLIVCKGRRRIGKSRLIAESARSAGKFYEFQGLAPKPGQTNRDQLQNFSWQLADQCGLPPLELRDWSEAFALLAQQVGSGEAVVLLDEISWMAAHDKSFVGKLKIAWDTKFKTNTSLRLVLCGSVSSWIDTNILADTSFVGRIGLTLHLKELALPHCGAFWGAAKERVSANEKLRLLSVLGGVPRYLEEIDPTLTAEQNVKALCFDDSGLLFSEFEELFNSTFAKRAEAHKRLIGALGSGHRSLTQIADALDMRDGGSTSRYLGELVQSGFVSRDFSWHLSGKKAKASRYRLQDNYLRFYLRCIEPHKEKIAQGLFRFASLEHLPGWSTVIGLQIENLVLGNLPLIIDRLDLDPNSIVSAAPHIQAKTQRNRGGCQIDLLIHTQQNSLYLCEVKYRNRIDGSVIKEMQRKERVLQRPKNMSIRPVLIYGGELSQEVQKGGYFARTIDLGDFL